VLLIVAPLITTPYLSRVLGADGIGEVSFAESISSYFVLFATLGITTYGQREISYVQENPEERTRRFWNTKALEVITSIIMLAIYIPFSLLQDNKALYIILALNLFAVIADVTWFFQGMEEFGKIVLRNFAFKMLFIIYIFVVVKTRDDLVWYVFGIGATAFLSNLSLWVYLPRYVERPKWKDLKPFNNIRTVLMLFVPTIAIQVYTVLDKTMIGVITKNSYENGYYEQAIKISKLVLVAVTALGTVMIPRIGHHFGRGEMTIVKDLMYKSYRFVWFLGIPLCLGLIGTASNFVPWFFGAGFDQVIPLLHILSFLIIIIGISNVTGMQYLIPTQREKLFTRTVVAGAVVNFILNLVLIRLYLSTGAAIASVTAETVIAAIQLYMVRGELSVRRIVASCRYYLIAGIFMLLLLTWMGKVLSPSIIHSFEMVIAGGAVYFAALLLLKDEFLLEYVNIIKCKLQRR